MPQFSRRHRRVNVPVIRTPPVLGHLKEILYLVTNSDRCSCLHLYCHDKDTSPLRTSTHNLKPPSPVLTRITTIVRVNQNKRPTDQNKEWRPQSKQAVLGYDPQ
ncbi:hypothetical protein ABEB36_015229 [Hypothenemus hampei]|uniref:Uncharacterized protein n=1 Tax=Hypothenemus hampei TaxID=57062 RepID=A0ABD1E1R7_HYPHA